MAHQMLKPYSFLLYFLSILAFFFIGLTYAGIVEAGKNQGLAGGAIVLGYGVMGVFVGIVLALFIANKTNKKIIFRLNIILAIIIVSFYVYYHLKYLEKQKSKDLEKQKNEQPKEPTKPIAPVSEPIAMLFNSGLNNSALTQNTDNGLGMFTPNFGEQQELYFYGNPNSEKGILEHTPFYSITFKKAEYGGYDIATVPPCLIPDHLKLDYDLLYFKV